MVPQPPLHAVHGDRDQRRCREILRELCRGDRTRHGGRGRRGCRHRPWAGALRRPVRRHEDRRPRFLRRAEKKLKREQRRLSRKAKGSKNREKARIKVAGAHAQVADARREFHHQLSTRIIRENQAVAVEDLAVKGLARTRLAKSVHDAGWSAFVAMLEYKAAKFGRGFLRIGRFEPTSQLCSQCGVKDGPKPLHIRVWECGACGALLDRDINAAVNIAKAAGLAASACGAQVRPVQLPAQRDETGTHRDGHTTVVGITSL